jgi:hypothetical protein
MDSDWVTNRSSDLSSGPPHPTGTGTPSHGLLSGAGRRGSLSQARERERERERESPEQEEEEEEEEVSLKPDESEGCSLSPR